MLSILVGLILIVGVLAYCIRQGRAFYGWLIVGILFVTLGLSHTVWHSFSVFQVALYEHFGWSREEAALGFSVMAFSHALSGIAMGFFADRFGARKTILIGATTAAIGFIAASRLNSLWQFYLFYGVLSGAGMNAFGSIPGNFLIGRWFLRERGVAFGLSTSGVGVGILVMVPLAQLIIINVDWRAAFLTLGLIFLIVVPPLALLFIRDRPEELGLSPDGIAGTGAPTDAKGLRSVTEESLIIDRNWTSQDWTLGKAIATKRFWMMAAGFATSNIFVQTFLAHHVAYMTEVGYDRLLSASIAGFVGLA
ncbi:MAG: MFS transporter, partial [Chloroflexi bacterium]|nr:MFS transporter [Chloroflexota bacterium]